MLERGEKCVEFGERGAVGRFEFLDRRGRGYAKRSLEGRRRKWISRSRSIARLMFFLRRFRCIVSQMRP